MIIRRGQGFCSAEFRKPPQSPRSPPAVSGVRAAPPAEEPSHDPPFLDPPAVRPPVTRPVRKAPARCRPAVEALEDRLTPAAPLVGTGGAVLANSGTQAT